VNATIFLGCRVAEDRLRDASGALGPTLHFREVDLGLFLAAVDFAAAPSCRAQATA